MSLHVDMGLSDLADNPNGDTGFDRAASQAIHNASTTSILVDREPLQVALFNLSDDERARASASKCVVALGLDESIKQIAHYIAMSQCLDTMDVDRGILDIAIARLNAERRRKETEVTRTYTNAAARCLKSLSFPEMGAREANIERPARNTCEWIYTNATFRQWEAQINTLLWIKGKPGSGKSTLMKSLYQKRNEHRGNGETANSLATIHIGFFFNARGAAIERTPIGLYITLLHGVLRQIPSVMCEFLPVFLEKEFYSQDRKIAWQVTEVAQAFHSIIGQKQPKYIEIMIDALDECEDDEVRSTIRRFESSIAEAQASGAELRVCWSSRYYPHISLKSKHGLELRLDKQNDSDIRQYVEKELPEGVDSSILSIREDMISRANGVFLWAVLATKRLLKAIDQGEEDVELRRLLNSIPHKLDDLFDEIFKNADNSIAKRQELVRMAQWIFCAFRPLTIDEFFTAMLLQSINKSMSFRDLELSTNAHDRLKKRIIDVSGGLFEVAETGYHTRVQVIHESVREFFLGPKGLSLLQASSRESFVLLGHKELALGCFKALLSKEFDSVISGPNFDRSKSVSGVLSFLTAPWMPPENTFLETYVQDFVFEHFDRARSIFNSESLADSPFEALDIRRRVLENFLRLCCSQIKENQTLRPGFSAHLQKVSRDPLAFNFNAEELAKLMVFVNNQSACSFFFSCRHIYMFEEDRTRGKSKGFIALFYACRQPSSSLKEFSKDWYLNSKRFWYGNHSPGDGSDHEIDHFMESTVRFAFAMTFTVRGSSDPISLLTRMVTKSTKVHSDGHFAAWPLVLSDIVITEDLDEIAELRKYAHIFKKLPKARLHEYAHPTTLCLVLQLPDIEGSPSSTSEILAEDLYVGSGFGSMPNKCWWRPRKQGRDRNVFEADTDSDSDDQDQEDRDQTEREEDKQQILALVFGAFGGFYPHDHCRDDFDNGDDEWWPTDSSVGTSRRDSHDSRDSRDSRDSHDGGAGK